MSTDNLSVWVDDTLACVKITGRAGCPGSVGFRTLILGLHDKGWRRFILDLTDCQLMDSTFLGVLAGLALRFSDAAGTPRATLELLNASPRITGLLDNLGVAEHFRVLTAADLPADALRPLDAAPSTPATHEEIQRASLAAHQLLIQLNPANAAMFKDVCQFLADDLKKLEKK